MVKHSGEADAFCAASEYSNGGVPIFPAVAVGADVDAAAKKGFYADDRWQLIDHASRHQDRPSSQRKLAIWANDKVFPIATDCGYQLPLAFYGIVAAQLGAREVQQLVGRDSVMTEKTM